MNLARFFWLQLPMAIVGGTLICILGPLSIIPLLGKVFGRWVESYCEWLVSL